MKRIVSILLAVCLFFACSLTASADYTDWQDPQYDFKAVKTVYVGTLDTSEVQLSLGTGQKLKGWLLSRGKKIKGVKVIMEEAPRPWAMLPGESPAPKAEEAAGEHTVIPEAAVSAGADLYVLPRLTAYQVDAALVPPHTDWEYESVPEYWRDRDGNWHTYYRTISYPVYVPAHYVPNAGVAVTFEWYDVKTGNLAATSTDERLRGSEDDPYPVYKRIVDRFVKRANDLLGK